MGTRGQTPRPHWLYANVIGIDEHRLRVTYSDPRHAFIESLCGEITHRSRCDSIRRSPSGFLRLVPSVRIVRRGKHGHEVQLPMGPDAERVIALELNGL